MTTTTKTYQVYRATETGLPFDHQTIFVETHEDGPKTGHLYHVKGNIAQGMEFEHRPSPDLEESPMFGGKRKVGTVSAEDYPERFLAVCEGVEAPKKQFEGSKRLFPDEKLRRCGEWAEEAVAALIREGVLRVDG